MGVNRKTAAYFFHRLRELIARQLEDSLPVEGLIEVDQSYFGGGRKGKRGRGSAGKVPVFGILKRTGKVYTVMIPDVARTRCFPSSESGIDHSDAYVRERHNHINGIENFWNRAKRTLSRYNGIPKAHFHLLLKETEFRWNFETPRQQLRILKRWAKIKP